MLRRKLPHRSAIWVGCATAGLAAALVACSSSPQQAPGGGTPGGGASGTAGAGGSTTTLNIIAPVATPTTYPLLIAVAAKEFQRYHLNPAITTASSDAIVMTAFNRGSAPLAWASSTAPLTDLANASVTPFYYVYFPVDGVYADLVLTKAAAAKTHLTPQSSLADRIKALQGMTIATPSASSADEVLLESLTKKYGVTYKSVYLSHASMLPSFTRGSIDGFVQPSPTIEQGVQAGGVIWLNGRAGDFAPIGLSSSYPYLSLMLTKSEVSSQPQVAAEVIATFISTAKFIVAHPQQAEAYMSAQFGASIGASLFKQVWANNVGFYSQLSAQVPTARAVTEVIQSLPPSVSSAPSVAKLSPSSLVVPQSVWNNAMKLVNAQGSGASEPYNG